MWLPHVQIYSCIYVIFSTASMCNPIYPISVNAHGPQSSSYKVVSSTLVLPLSHVSWSSILNVRWWWRRAIIPWCWWHFVVMLSIKTQVAKCDWSKLFRTRLKKPSFHHKKKHTMCLLFLSLLNSILLQFPRFSIENMLAKLKSTLTSTYQHRSRRIEQK